MGFMQAQVVYGTWVEVELEGGSSFWLEGNFWGDDLEQYIPESCFGDGKIRASRLVDGWGARLSAPGYLDCTEWDVFETEEEAWEYLADTYDVGQCEDCGTWDLPENQVEHQELFFCDEGCLEAYKARDFGVPSPE